MEERLPVSDGLKIFVSYSRAQVAFADELELALSDKGYQTLIDRHSIAKGEAFQKRLGEMILASDTVVFILSDDSAMSKVCAWEIEEALRLSKRVLVVTISELSKNVTPPSALAKIDWIHCWSNPKVPGSSQTKGFIELDGALRVDLKWVRQRTKLLELAEAWIARTEQGLDGTPALLRGELLSEALLWSSKKPGSEAIPSQILTFLTKSNAAQLDAEQREAERLIEREAALVRAEEAVRSREQQARRARLWRRLTNVAAIAAISFLAFGVFVLAKSARSTAGKTTETINALAEVELEKGNLDAAIRLSLLASQDSFLRPASKSAEATLLRGVLASHKVFEISGSHFGGTDSSFSGMASCRNDRCFALRTRDGRIFFWTRQAGEPWSISEVRGELGRAMNAELSISSDAATILHAPTSGDLELISKDEEGSWERTVLNGYGGSLASDLTPTGNQVVNIGHRSFQNHPLLVLHKLQPDGVWSETVISDTDGNERAVAISDDAKMIIVGGTDGSMDVWESACEEECWARTSVDAGHTELITSVDIGPDGVFVVTSSRDGTVRIHTMDSEHGWSSSAALTETAAVMDVQFDSIIRHPDFGVGVARLFLSTADGKFSLWESATLRLSNDGVINFVDWRNQLSLSNDDSALYYFDVMNNANEFVTISSEGELGILENEPAGKWRGEPMFGDFDLYLDEFSYDHTTWVKNTLWADGIVVFSRTSNNQVESQKLDLDTTYEKQCVSNSIEGDGAADHSVLLSSTGEDMIIVHNTNANINSTLAQLQFASEDVHVGCLISMWNRDASGHWHLRDQLFGDLAVRASSSDLSTLVIQSCEDELAHCGLEFLFKDTDGLWARQSINLSAGPSEIIEASPNGAAVLIESQNGELVIFTNSDHAGFVPEPLVPPYSNMTDAKFSEDAQTLIITFSNFPQAVYTKKSSDDGWNRVAIDAGVSGSDLLGVSAGAEFLFFREGADIVSIYERTSVGEYSRYEVSNAELHGFREFSLSPSGQKAILHQTSGAVEMLIRKRKNDWARHLVLDAQDELVRLVWVSESTLILHSSKKDIMINFDYLLDSDFHPISKKPRSAHREFCDMVENRSEFRGEYFGEHGIANLSSSLATLDQTQVDLLARYGITDYSSGLNACRPREIGVVDLIASSVIPKSMRYLFD